MRRVPRLLAAALAVMVVLAGALPSVVLASDIASVKRACDGTVPLFESIVVETARRSWRPPVVRCTLVDRAGDSYTETLWGWDELGVLAALDVAGMTLVATGLRRRRNRGTLSSGALADRRA